MADWVKVAYDESYDLPVLWKDRSNGMYAWSSENEEPPAWNYSSLEEALDWADGEVTFLDREQGKAQDDLNKKYKMICEQYGKASKTIHELRTQVQAQKYDLMFADDEVGFLTQLVGDFRRMLDESEKQVKVLTRRLRKAEKKRKKKKKKNKK